MRRKALGRAGALAALTAALCLAQGGVLAAEASAEEYHLDKGSVTVTASDGKQYVTQANVADNVLQTSDTVILQTDASAPTANTITVVSESGQTARVTLSGVNVDVSDRAKAAVSTGGAGGVTVTLLGQNSLKSGDEHAGLEKGNDGNLTITAKDTDQSLDAEGGHHGAGIGGARWNSASNITVSGGTINASGSTNMGYSGGAGIGGGQGGDGTDIAITGGEVTATGGYGGAGIGGGGVGDGSNITISGGKVTATGGIGGAGIGGGDGSHPDGGGNGTGIAISGGEVTAMGGGHGAAGIGGGSGGYFNKTSCRDVALSGSARLRVRGGTMDSVTPHHAAGASIGGGAWDSDDGWRDGEETEPDVCALATDGWIEYYAAGEEMTEENLTKTVVGTGDHAWDDGTVTMEPTCTEPGERTYVCTRNPEHPKRTEAVPATGHDWRGVTYTWSKDHSICTATRTCRTDADHVEVETVDAVATVTQPLTCTDDELTTYTATFENEAFETQAVKNVKTASATGHDFTAEKADAAHLKSAATCTERAVYYTSCASCGLSSKGTDDEATFEAGEPDPTNHGHLACVAAKAATTRAEGNTEYWYCSACKRYFSDAAGTKEVKQADTVIARKGEPAKKKSAIPATGDNATVQAALLTVGSLATLGAALLAKRRTA